jgi:hypothetical protein
MTAAHPPKGQSDGFLRRSDHRRAHRYRPRHRFCFRPHRRRPTARPGLSTGTIGGAPEDLDKLRRFRGLGAEPVNVSLMSEARDDILPRLDKWAGYVRQLRD